MGPELVMDPSLINWALINIKIKSNSIIGPQPNQKPNRGDGAGY